MDAYVKKKAYIQLNFQIVWLSLAQEYGILSNDFDMCYHRVRKATEAIINIY